MKNIGIKIGLFIILGLFMIITAGCDADRNAEHQIKSFSAEEIKEIYISTDGQNIELLPTHGEQVAVSMKTNSPLPAILAEGVLTIKLDASSKYINFKSKTLYVEIPNRLYQILKLTSASGNISLEKINAKEITILTDSGNISVKGFEGEITAATDSGKISSSLDISSSIIPKASGYTLNGGIHADNATNAQLKLHSVSGNITLD